MPLRLGYVDKGSTGSRLEAEQAAAWRQHRRDAEVRQEAEDRALEAHTLPVFAQLGDLITRVESQEGWVALAERVEALADGADAEAPGLSRRQETELTAQLRAVAVCKGWLAA